MTNWDENLLDEIVKELEAEESLLAVLEATLMDDAEIDLLLNDTDLFQKINELTRVTAPDLQEQGQCLQRDGRLGDFRLDTWQPLSAGNLIHLLPKTIMGV